MTPCFNLSNETTVNQAPYYTKLHSYLKEKGLKTTKQRDQIVETFFALDKTHVKIEELLSYARKKNPSIGYATVYRTLLLLVDAGLAHQRHFGKGKSQFELCRKWHHDHLICTECGKIIEFHSDIIEELQTSIANKHNFDLSGHKMELYGYCSDCKSKK
ncbi:MAG: Fur family transcriptional regulator [bacterium]